MTGAAGEPGGASPGGAGRSQAATRAQESHGGADGSVEAVPGQQPHGTSPGGADGSAAAAPGHESRGASTSAPAALVIARAPSAGPAKPELEPLLGADRCADLQALLIRRAAAWAADVAPGAAYVAVAGPLEDVRGLLPPGVTAFAQEGDERAEVLAAAIARIGRGPLVIAGTDCARLSRFHAAAALDDLAAGCDVAIGATLEGGWYLAGLREPRPELLAVAPVAWQREGGMALVLRRGSELRAEVGMLRHERLLVTPADAAALLADPLLPDELRAALS